MERWKQVFGILICCMVMLLLQGTVMATDTEVMTGTCGDNLTWSLDTTTKTLTISGTGAMKDYGVSPTYAYDRTNPWFSNRTNINTVVVEDGVTTIGNYAFALCPVQSISLPDGITSVGDGAFEGNAFADITIPGSVKSIGHHAFKDCNKITAITIPDGAESIDSSVFFNCTKLRSISIPNTVTSIGSSAFTYGNHVLSEIVVAPDNPNYCSEDGVLFNKDKTELICYPRYKQDTSYSISSTVTTIQDNAFWDCDYLTSITVPGSISTIEHSTFQNCGSLQNVIISDGVTSIEQLAFSSCKSLMSVTIPNSITAIGDSAFSHCTSLSSIIIPGSVSKLGTNVFYNCTALTEVVMENGVTSIDNSTFEDCSKLSRVIIPDTLKSIGKSVFYGCSALCSITIPSSVTSIGDSAFSGTSLTSVSIPGSVKTIGDYAFGGCSSLSDVTLSQGTNSIGSRAFESCQISSIDIPEGVTTVGASAFLGNKITSVSIPSSVTSIGYSAFSSQYLTELNVDPNNISYTSEGGVLFSKDKTTLHSYPANKDETSYIIPNGVINIGENSFKNCKKLSAVIIPNSVTTIGHQAFYLCSLNSIEIPNSVTSIGSYAFASNESLIKAVVPDSVTSMGGFVFAYCDGLSSAGPIGGNYDLEYGWRERLPANTFGGSEVRKIVIAKGITKLCTESLYSCSNLTDLYVPLSVTSMERMAFGDTYNIETVYYEGTESDWAAIGGKTLYGNTKFDSVTFHYNASWNEIGVTGITLDKSSITLTSISATETLTATVLPENATDKTVIWASGNADIVSVSAEGVVTALSEGKGIITASTKDGNFSATCEVTVDISDTVIPVTSITLDKSTMTLTTIGATETLVATVLPENATNRAVTWTSSDENVATVNDGVVTAVGNGSATITAAVAHGIYKVSCIVKVGTESGKFQFSASTPTNCITVGSTFELYVGYYVDGQLNPSFKDYNLVVSDGNIIDVEPGDWNDQYGRHYMVTAKKNGYSTIAVSNPQNNDANALELYVVSSEAGYTFDGVPKMTIEDGKTTNFYNYSGLVVDEFKAVPATNRDGEITHYSVTMNIYNSKAIYAAVTVYDAEGNLTAVRVVDRMNIVPDNFVDSVDELIKSTGDLFYLIKNDKYYSGESISKKTEISEEFPIEVPVGGYLSISNNAEVSEIVGFINTVGLIVNSASSLYGAVDNSDASDIDGILNAKKTIIEAVTTDYIEEKLIDTIKSTSAEEFTNVTWGYDSLGDGIQAFLSRLSGYGINLMEKIDEKIVSIAGVASIGEAIIKNIVPTGKIIDLLYSWAEMEECKATIYILLKSADFPTGIHIYAPEINNTYDSNGISVEPPVMEDEVVVHAYRVLNANETGVTFPDGQTYPEDAYETYSITMYKNGVESQPDATVVVKIPLSEKFKSIDPNRIKVYRHNEDGSLRNMNAIVENGYVVFSTDHFSYYSIVDGGNTAVTGITLNKSNTMLTSVGVTETLTATISPSDATNKSVRWISSRPSVATVSDTGVVTAVSNGQTTITVITADGGYTAACIVTVEIPDSPTCSITFDANGGSGTMSAQTVPAGTVYTLPACGFTAPSGKEFQSWSISGTPYSAGSAYTISGDTTILALWKTVADNSQNDTDTGNSDNGYTGGGGNATVTPKPKPEQPKDEPTPSVTFSDVPADAYYADAVAWAVAKGITNGTGDGLFSPNAPCTRGQMVTFLYRAAGEPATNGVVNFTDVSARDYYARAVAWAVENGITNGTGDGLFSPDAECSRAQMAVLLFRMVGGSAAGASGFGDVDADAYYADAVAWAVANGITNGTGEGLFSPNASCTRGQMVTFLYRCFGAQH